MSSSFRTVLFWLHLVSGLVAGLVIGVMSLTGAALAFKPQLLEWAERDLRTVQPPAEAVRLPLEGLVARVRAAQPEARPEARPSAVTVFPEPTAAVLVALGRTGSVFVNPYTGEVRSPGPGGLRAFLLAMEDWHRWLGTAGEGRQVGKAITGACNTAFLVLALTGLVLWWPRRWTWRAIRPAFWFRRGLKGKARDFNWHNTTGFWALPVLVVLTVSGMVISYRWASNLVFTLTGNTPPAAAGPGAPPAVTVPEPPPGAQPLGMDVLLAEAQQQVPDWAQLTVRLGGAPARGPQGQGAAAPRPEPLTVTVRERDAWPRFASLQLVLDPYTGKTLVREGYADSNSGRQLRTWLRFLHTGEALGWVGQLLAGLASLGGGLLVWTGFALSWRRLRAWRRSRALPAPEEVSAASPEQAA